MSGERPILFSGPMAGAILNGRKSETRRVVKPQGPLQPECWDNCVVSWGDHGHDGPGWYAWDDGYEEEESYAIRCPYGEPGYLLWVRESHWRYTGTANSEGSLTYFVPHPEGERYQSRCYDDHPELDGLRRSACVVRVPSIHMPKWACRLWLRVEDVRVERLQEITREGAIAEGAFEAPDEDKQQAARVALKEGRHEVGPLDYFRELWESINGSRAPWASNPWVWVVKFSRTEAP